MPSDLRRAAAAASRGPAPRSHRTYPRIPLTLPRRAAALPALLLLLLITACAPATARGASVAPGAEPPPRELVVLVHGMGRTPLSMAPLEWTLERAGYDVLNWGYSSTCCTIDELGTRLARAVREHPAGDAERVHFVGHSLGGILIRRVLAEGDLPLPTGRVVLLAPPNQGSRAADRSTRAFGWLLRPLPELRTASMRGATRLTIPAAVDVGVIAGRHDGKVSVAESHLAGEDAHVVVPAAHTFLMLRRDVRRLVLDFLRTGSFEPDPAPRAAIITLPSRLLIIAG
jgi:pimeloyl-ACP methyl ester carboxylesterase